MLATGFEPAIPAIKQPETAWPPGSEMKDIRTNIISYLTPPPYTLILTTVRLL